MLRRVKAEGFKSLRSTEVELGSVNVFIGPNGSGKSNVLESIGVAGSALFGTVSPETLKHRGVRPGVQALYKSSFAGARLPRLIKLEIENEAASGPNHVSTLVPSASSVIAISATLIAGPFSGVEVTVFDSTTPVGASLISTTFTVNG